MFTSVAARARRFASVAALATALVAAPACKGLKDPSKGSGSGSAGHGSGSAASTSRGSGAAGGTSAGGTVAKKLPKGLKPLLKGKGAPEPKITGPTAIAAGKAPAPFKPAGPAGHDKGAQALMQTVAKAYYDQATLGLSALRFFVTITEKKPKHTLVVVAEGAWKKGDKAPLVAVREVSRDGTKLDRSTRIKQAIFTSSRFRARRLLQGLGHSFLRPRIAHMSRSKAKSLTPDKNAKGPLVAVYTGEFGKTTVRVARDYRIEAISNSAPSGVTRTMTYKHKKVGGRYLVTHAKLSVDFAAKSTVPKKARLVLEASNGLELRFSYKRVGVYEMPVSIVKTMPKLGLTTTIALRYVGLK